MFMNINVFTPDQIICSAIADEIILPGLTGQISILNNHSNLVTALDTGLLRIKSNDKWILIVVCEGLAEINQNKITILANEAEKLNNLELSCTLKEFEQATLAIKTLEKGEESLSTLHELKKATAKLEAINYL